MDIFFATLAHSGQMYGEKPYTFHLDMVDGVLVEYGFGEDLELRAAGQLHDVLEDCLTVKVSNLRLVRIPDNTVNYVMAVTSEPGKNRKERNAKTYPKIKAILKAIALKLADRIANVRNSISENSGLLSMYKKEYPEFRAALYTDDASVAAMWQELDRLLS